MTDNFDNRKMAGLFKALGDENRLDILGMLGTEEKCACVLLEDLHISQPTLSHHMKILSDAGLVECRREGKWAYYRLSDAGLTAARLYLSALRQTEGLDCSCIRLACKCPKEKKDAEDGLGAYLR